MIRFIIIVIIVVGFLILSIPILLAEWLIGKFRPYTKDISSLRLIQWIFRVILKITGLKLEVIGEENVPKEQAVLYIGNHRSFFDVLITYARCPRRTGYVAKKELERIPLLSNWMKYLHCLFLDRTDLKAGMKMILTGIDKLKSGISICIFPEGTRSRGDRELPMLSFHEGSFKMAQKTDCPIIPMAMVNTCEIFEAHFPKIRPTHVILEYGKPIVPSQLAPEDRKHLGAYTQRVIEEMLTKNRAALEERRQEGGPARPE